MKNNVICWSEKESTGYIIKNKNQKALFKKPDLGFEYHSILFFENNVYYKDDPDRREMSEEEKNACINYIKNYSLQKPRSLKVVFGVGEKLQFLGSGSPGDFNRHAITSPSDDYHYYSFTEKKWKPCHGVNESGEYLGRLSPVDCFKIVDSTPPNNSYTWDFTKNKWRIPYNIEVYKKFVIAKLDNKIDEHQRRNYLFTLGQQIVYDEKLRQANKVMNQKSDKTCPADCKLIKLESAYRCLSIKDMSELIIRRANDYKEFVIDLEELRIDAKCELEKCTTPEECESKIQEFIDDL